MRKSCGRRMLLCVHRDYPGLFHGFLTMMPFSAGAAGRELLWADMARLLAIDVEAPA